MTGARMNDDELVAETAVLLARLGLLLYSGSRLTPVEKGDIRDGIATIRRLAADVAVKDTALARVEDAVDFWESDSHDAAACKKFTCVDCVVVNCDFDIRAALGEVGDHTTTDDGIVALHVTGLVAGETTTLDYHPPPP